MISFSVDLNEYHAAREALIIEDRALRRDHSRNALSAVEATADRVIRSIRAEEATTIWGAEHPDITHPFPGMEFLNGRSIIVKTKLFEILLKMPKGALLHAHLDATVNASYLWKLALEHPALHIRVPITLTKANLSSVLPVFQAFPREEYSTLTSLCDSPKQWVSLVNARSHFPIDLGGPEGFDKWIIDCMTINPNEAYGTHNTVAKIWGKFSNIFEVSMGLTSFAPIFAQYIKEFLLTSIADGISYVEPRVNFLGKGMYDEEGKFSVTNRDKLAMIDRVCNEVKEQMKAEGREHAFIGAKIIYSTLRFITPDELHWYTEECIALKKEFPHLIAGFDLVGNENELSPLISYLEPLMKFRHRQKEEGVDIPFIFHAGETLGDGTEADDNLYDAILLGTKRIGHGFSLVKHPKLMELCREREIAIEVCPISNEILRLTSSMPMHPLPILLNNGIPVALCSDDPAIFGNMGLTFDFFQVLVSSEVTGLVQLRELARDSLKYSTLDEKAKELAISEWEKSWVKFVEDIAELA